MTIKIKCFWCNKFFLDLVKHTKTFHPNLNPRSYGEKMKSCYRHKWRVGSFIGILKNKRVRKVGINIWCQKCNKSLKAYYRGDRK